MIRVFIRKKPIFSALLGSLMLSACGVTQYESSSAVQALNVQLSESGWNGVDIPSGQQCRKYLGDGHSPQITVSNIPAKTEALIIEFSDHSWFPMNHGGHGKLGMTIKPNQQRVIVPSVAGETFELPEDNLFIFQPHRGGRGQAGAYLPPCSGGRGNDYFAEVKAVRNVDTLNQSAQLLGEGSLFIGKY